MKYNIHFSVLILVFLIGCGKQESSSKPRYGSRERRAQTFICDTEQKFSDFFKLAYNSKADEISESIIIDCSQKYVEQHYKTSNVASYCSAMCALRDIEGVLKEVEAKESPFLSAPYCDELKIIKKHLRLMKDILISINYYEMEKFAFDRMRAIEIVRSNQKVNSAITSLDIVSAGLTLGCLLMGAQVDTFHHSGGADRPTRVVDFFEVEQF